jgi:broad specificity phosphatase PhoE
VELLRERLLQEPPVSALYSSPLQRALETARAVPVEPLRVLASFAEISCGELEGHPIEEVQKQYPEHWRRNEAQLDESFCWPGGESYRRFRRRVLRAVRIMACKHPGQRIAIVTHAGVINQIAGYLRGQSAARWENFRPHNASLTQVEWYGDTGRLIRFDDCTHLRS